MMLLNLKDMNYISRFFYFIILLSTFICSSQENEFKDRIKVDGISSVVGDFIILESDIDKVMIDMESQGISTRCVSKCHFGKTFVFYEFLLRLLFVLVHPHLYLDL